MATLKTAPHPDSFPTTIDNEQAGNRTIPREGRGEGERHLLTITGLFGYLVRQSWSLFRRRRRCVGSRHWC